MSPCEKEILSDKFRDHRLLTRKNRGPAHNKCNKNITQKQSNFNPLVCFKFCNYECHLFFKKLVAKKNDKVKFDILSKTIEETISVKNGSIRIIDSHLFLSSCLDSLDETFDDSNQ